MRFQQELLDLQKKHLEDRIMAERQNDGGKITILWGFGVLFRGGSTLRKTRVIIGGKSSRSAKSST